jgi:hypothetical protein
MARIFAAWLGIGCALACGGRELVGSDTEGETGGDPGTRPSGPGEMYAACEVADECDPLALCVSPMDEPGYCTAPCSAAGDPGQCAQGYAAPAFCLDIGLPEGPVCALDCAQAPCPSGMRCEAVATPSGEQTVCF